MSNRLTFLLNGQPVHPLNRDAFTLDFSTGNYSADGEYIFFPQVRLEQNQLQLVGSDVEIVRLWLEEGRIWEGIPLEVYDEQTEQAVFDQDEACLDLSAADFSMYPDEILAPILDKRLQFSQRAESLNFLLLREQGFITPADYVNINYVIAEVPDYHKAATLSMTLYIMVREGVDQVQKIADLTAESANPFSSPSGIAKVAIQVVALISLGIAITNMLKSLSDALFQKPRYYRGMKFKTLLEKACQYLGLELDTALFDTDFAGLTLLPEKDRPGARVGRTSDDEGCPDLLLADLLRDIGLLFNAKAKVQDNTLVLKRWDEFIQPNGVVLPRLKDAQNREYPVSTNAAELPAVTFVRFKRDNADHNTYRITEGYSAQSHIAQTGVLNERFNTLKGLRQVELPYAKAARKNSTSALEDIFASIIDAVNKIPGIGGGGGLRGRRVGCMELGQDAIGVPKALLVEPDGMVSEQDANYVNARHLLTQYHHLNTPLNNQQYVYRQPIPTPLSTAELKALIENPVAEDEEGKEVLVEECVYDPATELYNLKLRYFENYTSNLEETITDGR
jgi:hypothetical protein